MKNVNTHHKDFDTYSPKWKRVRHVIDGQDAVHKAGVAYLPKLKDQEDLDYYAYVARANFYNATWRTLSGLLGMMFRKPPQVQLPGAVEGYSSDIDMAGTTLDTFVRKVALEVMGVGRVGIMVDHPSVDGAAPITVKVAEEQGLRPMLKAYRAETIINWKYARINNYWSLAMVVLEEALEEPEDEFKSKGVTQWRVLDLLPNAQGAWTYRQRVFRKTSETEEFEQVGDDVFPLMNGKPLGFIPFYIVGVDGVDSDLDEPPMIDLVDLNLSHYRTTADYEHGCHFTGLPTAVVSGYTPDDPKVKLYIGSAAAWVFPDPNASANYLEFTGQGLGALRDNLDRKEQQMAILGARMLAEEKRTAETATTASIHRTGENSVLSSIAQAISEGLEKALTVFAMWSGAAGTVAYQLNRDYNPAMLGAAELTALLKAVQAGELSSQSFFALLQRADIVDAETTFEEEQERIDSQGPARPVAANDPTGEIAA